MEEKKEAVEKTVDQPIEKVEEIKKEQPRDKKGRFKSAGDDNVIKIDHHFLLSLKKKKRK